MPHAEFETKFYACDPTDEGVTVDVLAAELAADGWHLHSTTVKASGLIRAEFRRPASRR